MKALSLIMCACVALLATGTLITHGQEGDAVDSPEAAYAEVQSLLAEVDAAEGEITELEFEAQRAREAASNYEYVLERNAAIILKLDGWVKAK